MQRRVEYKSNVKKLTTIMRRNLSIKMKSIQSILRNHLDRNLEGDAGRTGRQYLRPDGTPYTASAPGEWPSEKSGDLRSSITFETKVTNDEISLTMSAGVPYAETLENYMFRPFFLRSLLENEDEIYDILYGPVIR